MGRVIASGNKLVEKLIISAIFIIVFTMGILSIAFKDEKCADVDAFNGYSAASVKRNTVSAGVVIEADTKKIIGGENYDTPMAMASTTKVITASLACNSGKLDETVTIPKEATGIEGSSIYLRPQEKITLRDLTYGLMLRSGNDSAVAIAMYLGGSVEKFADMMNVYAEKCGAKNSHFVNPNGLHDDNHYTTAYDLALITADALKNEEFRKIVSTKSYVIKSDKEPDRYIANKNKMLNMYDGAIGVKTGYTEKAGRCLVSASDRDGLTVISVVLNEPDMWNKSIELLNKANDACKKINIAQKDRVISRIRINKSNKTVGLCVKNDVNYVVFDKDIEITYNIDVMNKIEKNIKNGEVVGKITFYDKNRLIFEENLYTIEVSENDC